MHNPARALRIYNAYRETHSYRAVGRIFGLSGERVRQILAEGTRVGIFSFAPKMSDAYREMAAKKKAKRLHEKSRQRMRNIFCKRREDIAAYRELTRTIGQAATSTDMCRFQRGTYARISLRSPTWPGGWAEFWEAVGEKPTRRPSKKRKLSRQQEEAICCAPPTTPVRVLAQRYGVSTNMIYVVRQRCNLPGKDRAAGA